MVILTRLEEILLMAIWRLRDAAYGVSVKKEVETRTGKKFTIGALYFSLDQLYKKGYVKKITGESTPERGGKKKTYYTLTDSGKSGLENARQIHNSLWKNINETAFVLGNKNE